MNPEIVAQTKSPTQIRAVLSKSLRRLRATHGVSQEKLAELCGLHRTYIGSVERGERNISLDNLERIATAFQITVAALLTADAS